MIFYRFLAKTDDDGIYKCVVTNWAGSTSRIFNVTILGTLGMRECYQLIKKILI